jgi:hypothetical protein
MAKGKPKKENKPKAISATGKEIKQYFIERQDKRGRAYFVNQSGKRVSREFVVKSKKRVFLESSKKSGVLAAGELIPKGRKKKATPPKENKSGNKRGTQLSINNFEIKKRLEETIAENLTLYAQIDGNTYEIESAEGKKNLLLFNFELQEKFYSALKPVTPSPFFNVKAVTSKKDKYFLIDFDSLVIGDDAGKSAKIKKAMKNFNKGKSDLNNRFFK